MNYQIGNIFCLEISGEGVRRSCRPPLYPPLYAPMKPINGFKEIYQYLVIESMKYLGSKCWDSLRALRNLF